MPAPSSLRRLSGWVLICCGLLLAVVGMGETQDRRIPAARFRLAAEVTPVAGSFGLSGRGDGLFPGAHARLPIVISNPNPFAIQVGSVATSATSDSPACSIDNLTFGQLADRVIVGANSSATTEVDVAMASAAPDGCQGVTFRLAFTGAATSAPGAVVPDSFGQPSQVLGSAQNQTGSLVRTGGDIRWQLAAALQLILLGALLQFGAHRRGITPAPLARRGPRLPPASVRAALFDLTRSPGPDDDWSRVDSFGGWLTSGRHAPPTARIVALRILTCVVAIGGSLTCWWFVVQLVADLVG